MGQYFLTQDHCHMLYISTVSLIGYPGSVCGFLSDTRPLSYAVHKLVSLATLASYVVFCLTQYHCHMLYISTVESSFATLAPYVVFCLTQYHCHMLYISTVESHLLPWLRVWFSVSLSHAIHKYM